MQPVGILCFQGDFERHGRMLESLGVAVRYVRTPDDLAGIDAIVLPGGESTTIGRLMRRFAVAEPLAQRIRDGMPAFGTCAGMILLAMQNPDPLQFRLSVLDIDVERNAYGRQVESFEADIEIPAIGNEPYRGVFIRAPRVTRLGDKIEVVATFEGRPVLLRSGSILAASFHPELTTDSRVHRMFLDMIASS